MDNFSLHFVRLKLNIDGEPGFWKDKDVQKDITSIVILGMTNRYCQFLKYVKRPVSEMKAG